MFIPYLGNIYVQFSKQETHLFIAALQIQYMIV